jgi:lipopolysaccharide export system permease protein
MILRRLDRYLLWEWVKIFLLAAIGLPLVVMLIQLTEQLGTYFARDLTPMAVVVAYLFSFPDRVFLIVPAAVLFATVFSLATMNRHSELTAAKASGESVYRLVLPVLIAAALASAADVLVGELAPPATRRHLELLGEMETRSQDARYNFVFRAEEGWVYGIRELTEVRQTITDVVLEREGTGPEYPTLAVQARFARWSDSTNSWLLDDGRFRVIPTPGEELTFVFDSMVVAAMTETPADLLSEPQRPQEMRYAELERYVTALERSGGDGRLLRVELGLKLAVPATCFIIALFVIPLVVTNPRAGGAFGVALSLGTAIVFLVLVQLSRTIGGGGLIPPMVSAWLPNVVFGAAGVWTLWRAPT